MPHSEPKPQPQSILRQESYDGPQESVSPNVYLGLSRNLHQSPRGTPKSVSISNQREVISPLILGNEKSVNCEELDKSNWTPPTIRRRGSKRLSGRLPNSPFLRPNSGFYASSEANEGDDSSLSRDSGHQLERMIDQVSEWIKAERAKRAEKSNHLESEEPIVAQYDGTSDETTQGREIFARRRDSDASFRLDKLEAIIKHTLVLERTPRRNTSVRRRGSLKQILRRQSTASSDTDYYEGDILVPSCNVVLDNSNTLSYTGGASDDSDSSGAEELQRVASYKDRDAWAKFKFEIVRLSHTLRLKGWRRVPMDMSDGITVQRLSGALTNAVYVITPPADLPPRENTTGQAQPSKPPQKLLLRIYGPQVEHLIDREAELAILQRLARKKIGPRLLGKFENGRFEEYFYAKTLKPEDLREPDTSRQIAKRMRELHDGIELLDQERDDGPFVWRNWDKWVQRVEQVVLWLDGQVKELEPGVKPTGLEAWKRRGFICGVPWKRFRTMVEKHRAWLEAQYGGREKIKNQLVFAHNDAQYGNILRLLPSGDSPLLLPQNTHKQLVVIDFEYASANLPGLEFANHFTEWGYDYHDPRKPYAFHPSRYPTPEEQDRFIRAYVRHRPQFNVSTPKMAPTTPPAQASQAHDTPLRRPTSSISEFMLDARAPSSGVAPEPYNEAEHKAAEDEDVARLLHETRIWRLANTAQWVAWGLVQAEVPGMPQFDASPSGEQESSAENDLENDDIGERPDEYKDLIAKQQQGAASVNGSEHEEAEEEFDYLGYSQHRAMFFWADAIQLGLVDENELPDEVKAKLKKVPY